MNNWKIDPLGDIKSRIFDEIIQSYGIPDEYLAKISVRKLSDAIDEMFESIMKEPLM